MGTQSFRGAGGAGAVRTSRTQLETTPDENDVMSSDTLDAPATSAALDPDRRRDPRGRGWVLSLDVERRLREIRAHVSDGPSQVRSADDADDVALIRPCRAGF